ncbi:diacylglycerol kinase family protein [Candidatus Dojkabacteria bacterium]|uniref:Diacylglycerol kinase family protein n=1 Tax=Candidatus Dojkabacteria bacterium TaxID=2099670 RepID=A0A847D0J3_9BACT|nr:diacylglycerol kinase family protein [Candidatus Dojkabacteria bacterium]
MQLHKMKNHSYKSEDFFKSQGYARNGIKLIYKNERNFRIELVFTLLVILAGVFFKVTHFEWIALSLVISMVLISETINSAIEALCDTVTQDFKINVKYAKDVSAGAVLVSSLLSVITGLIIFLPYIIELAQNIFLR